VYHPYLLLSKKKYAGMLWTEPDKPDKMDTKGIETVRRDMCRLVGVVVQQVLDHLLIDKSPQKAQDYVKSIVERLGRDEIDLSLLIITRTLSKTTYKNKEPHVELQRKMMERDPGSAPVTGDRVAYVYVQRGTKVFEKAEDPNYVMQHHVPIDKSYYLTNQLANPVVRVFEPILGSKQAAYQMLFAGVETLTVKNQVSREKNTILRYTKPVAVCLGCAVSLPQKSTNQSYLCAHCEPRRAEIILQKSTRLHQAQQVYADLWMQCQTCQGSLTQKVICGNCDCPIYYMRTKSTQTLKEQQEVWTKLHADQMF
jgi:DNA polymerase delta subunit 1